MKIAVLVKTVSFVYAQTGSDIKKNCIRPEDIVQIVNPLDEVALECALKLKDARPGVAVTAIALGGGTAEQGLRKALAMGADQAIHVSCDQRADLDAMAASELLARACRRESFDLILCGATALDDNDGLEGPYLAERLEIPHVTNAVEFAVADKGLEVQRLVERGDRQLVQCTLPALLTVQKGSAVPRYPTMAGSLRSVSAPIRVLRAEALGITGNEALNSLKVTEVVGHCNPIPKRSPEGTRSQLSPAQRVEMLVKRDASKAKEGGTILEGTSPELFARLDRILAEAGIIKK